MVRHVYKVGIVGCGKIAGGWDHPHANGPASTHAQAYHRNPNFEVVAAVDPDIQALHRFQHSWDVPQGFRTLEEMEVSEPLDVVIICSPDPLHFPQAEQVLNFATAPKVLLIEKPVCIEPCELTRLTGLAEESQAVVAVNHTRRFDPAHRQVAQMVKSGIFGPFLQGRGVYYGGWIHNGVHLVDTLHMLFGERLQVVSAVPAGHCLSGKQDLDVSLLVDGSPFIIDAFEENHYQLFESEFRFQRGRIRLSDFGRTIIVEKIAVNGLGEAILGPMDESPSHGLDSPLKLLVESIEAHLRGESLLRDLGADLLAASVTMNTVWRARDLAAGNLDRS